MSPHRSPGVGPLVWLTPGLLLFSSSGLTLVLFRDAVVGPPIGQVWERVGVAGFLWVAHLIWAAVGWLGRPAGAARVLAAAAALVYAGLAAPVVAHNAQTEFGFQPVPGFRVPVGRGLENGLYTA